MAKKQAQTKNDAAARARAQAQAQLKAQERRTTVTIVAVSLIGVGLFVGIVMFIMNQGPSDGAAVSAADESFGIPVGVNGVVGQDMPTDAVRVDIYADYNCTACRAFEAEVGAEVDAMLREGLIELYIHPIAILDAGTDTSSSLAAAASAAVADQAPESFWAFHHEMFEQFPTQQVGPWTGQRLSNVASSVDVPTSVGADIRAAAYRGWVRDATRHAAESGVRATPTVIVDGEILDQTQVPYFSPGVLREYIEEIAAQ